MKFLALNIRKGGGLFHEGPQAVTFLLGFLTSGRTKQVMWISFQKFPFFPSNTNQQLLMLPVFNSLSCGSTSPMEDGGRDAEELAEIPQSPILVFPDIDFDFLGHKGCSLYSPSRVFLA